MRQFGVLPRIALLITLVAAPAIAQCPVDLFREYDPGRPPLILTDPPIRQIAVTPYVDPDSEPPATGLIYYRLNTRVDPDPLVPVIYLAKPTPSSFAIHWSGVGLPAGACCDGTTCFDLCPLECAARGGVYQGDGTACTDLPPPCGVSIPTCTNSGLLYGLTKPNGGGVTFGGSGFPTLDEVTLQQTDPATGATTPLGLTLNPEEQRVWNWTGTHDRLAKRYYYAGGRFDHATIAATIVTVDTATRLLVGAPPLNPSVNLFHVDVDHTTGNLFGLATATGGVSISSGHVHFPVPFDLVSIDPLTGVVTTVQAGLPSDLEHFAATLDSFARRYIYHTFDGRMHFVDLGTGTIVSIPSPEHYVDLQYDDSTQILYGLRTTGSSSFTASGIDGYRTHFILDLVSIDQTTGAPTVLNPLPLPVGTTNWASGFECDLHEYIYVSDTGETHVLNVTTGARGVSAPPPTAAKLHSLD